MLVHNTKGVIIHQPSYVWATAFVGTGSVIWFYSQIGDGCVIGEDVVIGSCCYVGFKSRIGNGTRIQHGVFLPNRSMIGGKVFIGPNVTFTDDKHPRAGNKAYVAQPPKVGDGASIGAGATILPGVVIGKGAVIGAGSVVTKDVPDGETWLGVPARSRRIGSLDPEERVLAPIHSDDCHA